MGTFHSGGDDVYEGNFNDVLNVLGGNSPWQSYLTRNLEVARKNITKETFNLESREDFQRDTKLSQDVAGITYKMKGKIYLEWQGSGHATSLLMALHECVHLVSHPASQGVRWSTAHEFLGEGLLEGLVEAVTEDILTCQKLSLPDIPMRGHQPRLAILKALCRVTGLPTWGRALFNGDKEVVGTVEKIYGPAGWIRIKNLAIINRTETAVRLINAKKVYTPQQGNR